MFRKNFRRRAAESTSSWKRNAFRRWMSSSPKKRMSRRALRPVTRRVRSSSSFPHSSGPRSCEIACRSSAEV